MHWRRRLVEDIVERILPTVFNEIPDEKIRVIHIDITFEYLPVQGFCMHIDGNHYGIALNRNQSREELITNVCHELVHVMQHERGDIFNYDLPYAEQPHEIEAYNKQDHLKEIYNGYLSKHAH